MSSLTPFDLLRVWETGYARPPRRRALLLLEAAHPEEPPEELAALPIGRRDGRLLKLRERLFGRELVALTDCPECGQRLESAFSVDSVRFGGQGPPEEEHAMKAGGYSLRFRLPNSLDLAALEGEAEEALLPKRLLERCLLSVRRRGREEKLEDLPSKVVEALVRRMGEADPQADVRTRLDCPSCSHQWEAVFDIVSFIWKELDAWAWRTLREVHLLASAYGWSESQVLSLSPWRRQFYLKCIGA
ncbi:MAG TPA: phage baseplate protein [Acidobacteriota bacterium]|nr:phage baseplate protein [Acidobacteriota bacterium]